MPLPAEYAFTDIFRGAYSCKITPVYASQDAGFLGYPGSLSGAYPVRVSHRGPCHFVGIFCLLYFLVTSLPTFHWAWKNSKLRVRAAGHPVRLVVHTDFHRAVDLSAQLNQHLWLLRKMTDRTDSQRAILSFVSAQFVQALADLFQVVNLTLVSQLIRAKLMEKSYAQRCQWTISKLWRTSDRGWASINFIGDRII
jgi:hypothetical protein